MTIVGEWISPGGRSLLTVPNDPFDVIYESGDDPGQLLIATPQSNTPIVTSHEGVYTCIMPDENDEDQHLYIGIYLSASKFELCGVKYCMHRIILI